MGYAVTNPATGETVKTYDTITDAELEAAIAAADEAHRTWSKSTTVDERARSWPRSSSARWASP
jgi:succinate-semialdehyde dehydrogenase/glutarate-semialdehyde dehydrogenase